ncbi:unnamed protein product [Miscanthus lutarioriparius]|uniref:Uncharacterized protein n=1 Tax=Miscanthus lutarioriparius TaxID=422564 RepID=A0A811SK60_9POAL|nr:unnamed protein product [Miscanthus lutarioriparius]
MESSATFRRIVRNKSTEDFRWLPYVTTLLSTSLWTFYGLLKPGGSGLLVITVNGAGAALEAVYVTLYLIYAPRETKAKMGKLVPGRERRLPCRGRRGGAAGAARRRPAVRGGAALRRAHHWDVRGTAVLTISPPTYHFLSSYSRL